MIEIPESTTISRQATDVLKGKIVADVMNATSPLSLTSVSMKIPIWPSVTAPI